MLRAALYSGSTIPGDGPWQQTAPIPPSAATSLVAAFNSGFRMSNAQGGYFSEGKTAIPLRHGAASFVIYANGTATVGEWGRDVMMGSNVVAVRQNLDLIVDGGKPVSGLNASDNRSWGATLGGAVYVWRSAVGVSADGAIVYAGGPGLNIVDLANVMVRAGAVRAMELDINTDWVNLATYAPGSPGGAATPDNGTDLLPNMVGTPSRYFESWWSRDFITMSVRNNLLGP
jgi:Phosphodiester glycosidase